jgi:hypothetical protein
VSPQSNKSNEGVILPIQYLRGIAAISVVLYHVLGRPDGLEVATSLADFIPSGVDLFFVISGFIMWVTTAHKAVTPRAFVVRTCSGRAGIRTAALTYPSFPALGVVLYSGLTDHLCDRRLAVLRARGASDN